MLIPHLCLFSKLDLGSIFRVYNRHAFVRAAFIEPTTTLQTCTFHSVYPYTSSHTQKPATCQLESTASLPKPQSNQEHFPKMASRTFLMIDFRATVSYHNHSVQKIFHQAGLSGNWHKETEKYIPSSWPSLILDYYIHIQQPLTPSADTRPFNQTFSFPFQHSFHLDLPTKSKSPSFSLFSCLFIRQYV